MDSITFKPTNFLQCTLSIISHFVNSHFVNTDQMGIDKVGIDKVGDISLVMRLRSKYRLLKMV